MSLKDEILAAFPGLPDGRNDGLIAAALSKGRTKLAPVPAASVRGAMYVMGVWPAVVAKSNAARANADTSQVALICQTLYDLSISDQPIPMDRPAANARVTEDLRLMVAEGIMSAPQMAYVLSMATVPDVITPALVAAALEGM